MESGHSGPGGAMGISERFSMEGEHSHLCLFSLGRCPSSVRDGVSLRAAVVLQLLCGMFGLFHDDADALFQGNGWLKAEHRPDFSNVRELRTDVGFQHRVLDVIGFYGRAEYRVDDTDDLEEVR